MKGSTLAVTLESNREQRNIRTIPMKAQSHFFLLSDDKGCIFKCFGHLVVPFGASSWYTRLPLTTKWMCDWFRAVLILSQSKPATMSVVGYFFFLFLFFSYHGYFAQSFVLVNWYSYNLLFSISRKRLDDYMMKFANPSLREHSIILTSYRFQIDLYGQLEILFFC